MLNSYKFAWDALQVLFLTFRGVPKRQFEMLMAEGDVYDYVVNTFDPLIRNTLLSQNQYFYHICLATRYAGNAEDQCPSYLTPQGFKTLKNSENLAAIKIHTCSILQLLERCEGQITKAILMDHLDWFDSRII